MSTSAFTPRRLKNSVLILAISFGALACNTLGKNSVDSKKPDPSVTLDLGRNWRCSNEGADRICRPVSAQDELKKVVITSIKERGADDSVASYRDHLGTVKKWKFHFRDVTSKPISNQTITLSGHEWVDAVQENSEVKGYTTRYLATVTDHLAVLVTFSARKELFAEFKKEIQPVVDQLKVNE